MGGASTSCFSADDLNCLCPHVGSLTGLHAHVSVLASVRLATTLATTCSLSPVLTQTSHDLMKRSRRKLRKSEENNSLNEASQLVMSSAACWGRWRTGHSFHLSVSVSFMCLQIHFLSVRNGSECSSCFKSAALFVCSEQEVTRRLFQSSIKSTFNINQSTRSIKAQRCSRPPQASSTVFTHNPTALASVCRYEPGRRTDKAQ